MRKIRVRVRTADVVDAADFFRHRLGPQIVRTHRIDEAERAAFLARAIVRHDNDQGVVAHACGIEEGNEPRQMLVGMIEHAGERRLQAGEDTLFVVAVFDPGLYAVIARRHSCIWWHQAHRLLPRETLLALDIPAMGERGVISF